MPLTISPLPENVCSAQNSRNYPGDPVSFEMSKHQIVDLKPELEGVQKQVRRFLGRFSTMNKALASFMLVLSRIYDH